MKEQPIFNDELLSEHLRLDFEYFKRIEKEAIEAWAALDKTKIKWKKTKRYSDGCGWPDLPKGLLI